MTSSLKIELADAIEAILPPGTPFALFVFGDGDGRSWAISNCDRREAALAVRDAANQILAELDAVRETSDRFWRVWTQR